MAVSRVLLARVAAGEIPACSRLYRPARALALTKGDLRRPGVNVAAAAARSRGFAPVVRLVGGQLVAYHEHALIYEHYTSRDDHASLSQRFESMASALVEGLRELGVPAQVGELAGEYCPGRYSVHALGQAKLAGLGQRVVRGAALVSASLIVARAEPVREALVDACAAMGLEWEPNTVGAVEDFASGISVEEAAGVLRAASARRRLPCPDVDDHTRKLASVLAREHRYAGSGVGPSVPFVVSDRRPRAVADVR